MAKYKDFCEYMEDNFYDVIFGQLKGYAARNKDEFESDEIYRVGFVEVMDIHVSGVTFKDIDGRQLEIRVTVNADLEVQGSGGKKYGYDTFDDSRQFNVFFNGLLENGLHNMTVTSVTKYNPAEYERYRSLSQNLVAYLYEEDVERYAEDFLKKYYPRALLQPMPLPVAEIVEKMGMEMYYAPLEPGIFGKTYFGEREGEVFENAVGRTRRRITTKPGTMLINPDVFFMYNVGTANNTIIHECVHWDRHRRAFELQKLIEGDCDHITCEIVETYDGIKKDDSAFKWMEWQANQLAPRILMPAKMIKQWMAGTLNRLHAEDPAKRNAELLEEAIREMAGYFNVSNLAAKLRVLDIGVDVAQGTFVYSNGHRLPPFSFRPGTLASNQTYIVDELNALQAIAISPELRVLYQEGKIIYANSMVAWNLPKYVTENEQGVPVLTDYALEHVHECCFVFSRKISASDRYSDSFYRRCFLCRDVNSETFIEASYDREHKDNQNKEERKKELDIISEEMRKIAEKMAKEIPSGFGGTLAYHMERKNISEETLAERTNISVQTISKYRNDIEPTASFPNVVALCNGLKLQKYYALDLLRKAKHPLDVFTPMNMAVDWLIGEHPDDTLEQWQMKLIEFKVPLTLPGCKDVSTEMEL